MYNFNNESLEDLYLIRYHLLALNEHYEISLDPELTNAIEAEINKREATILHPSIETRTTSSPSENVDHCVRCGEKLEDGITIWRVQDGWIHPKCANKEDQEFMARVKQARRYVKP